MERGGSLPCSQIPDTGSCLESAETIQDTYILVPKNPFSYSSAPQSPTRPLPFRLCNQNVVLTSLITMRAVCHVHLTLINLSP
jgi:hypothetical protein